MLFLCMFYQVGFGERRKGGFGQGFGSSTDGRGRLYSWGSWVQRGSAQSGGTAAEGKGKKSTVCKQEEPGTTPPTGTGVSNEITVVVC